jgi:hypothetical protein
LEVQLVRQVTNFFLGVNAGRWLGIRMAQICDDYQTQTSPTTTEETKLLGPGSWKDFLRDSGFELQAVYEEPPPDQALLFEHMGQGGNGGVSGQTILRSDVGFV